MSPRPRPTGEDRPGLDQATVEKVLKAFLADARVQLDEAVVIARKAEALATAGKVTKGVRTSLAIEPLLYEVRHFVNTASIINQRWRK